MKTFLNNTLLKALIGSIVLVGCGGGGSSDTASKVIIDTNADAIAYSAEDIEWTTDIGNGEALDNGLKQYTLDIKGKYSVALYCGAGGSSYLFELNTKNDPYIQVKCDHKLLHITYPVTGNLSDTTETPNGYSVALGTDYDIIQGASGTFDLRGTGGKHDLIAVTFKVNNGTEVVPQRFYIRRNISLPAFNNPSFDITFNPSNSTSIFGKKFGFANGTDGSLYLITENETYFTSQLTGKWYYPKKFLQASDIYLKYAYHTQNNTFFLDTDKAANIPKTDIELDASYINPLTQITYQNDAALGGWQNYQPSMQGYPLSGYLFYMHQTNTPNSLYLMISGERSSNIDGYTVPDISYLDGFQNSWWGDHADIVNASAVMSHLSFSQMMKSGRYTKLEKVHFFLVPDSTIEVANQTLK